MATNIKCHLQKSEFNGTLPRNFVVHFCEKTYTYINTVRDIKQDEKNNFFFVFGCLAINSQPIFLAIYASAHENKMQIETKTVIKFSQREK